MKIFVVIPAYHEEQRIGNVLAGVRQYVPAENIVVVDDGSLDQTAQKAKDQGVAVLQHVCNRGQGAALQTGTEYALSHGADIIVHFDADGQHRAEDILVLTQPFMSGTVDVVLGSRFLNSAWKNIPFTKRWFILPLARLVNDLMTGLSLTDAHNGCRALSRKAARSIHITQDFMAHNTDIVAQIAKQRLSYREVPVTILYHHYGQDWRGGIRVLWEIFKKKLVA